MIIGKRNRDMLFSLRKIVSQIKLLYFVTPAALMSPWIAKETGTSMALISSIIFCLAMWLQESLIIQLKYRSENIIFTRRFHDTFGDISRLIAFIPWLVSIAIIVYIVMLVKADIDYQGWIILGLAFLSLIRIFDPLLGCLTDPDSSSIISVLAYVVIFTFAISSSLDPKMIEYLSWLPWLLSQSILFILVLLISLQLRLAYYQKYCFSTEMSLETQLNFILGKLLILAIIQSIAIADSINLSSILGG